MQILLDDLQGPQIRALLEEHLADVRSISPPESVHALDLAALRQADIRFFCAWGEGGELLGCGAWKRHSADFGEIKSMRSARSQRGKGIGRAMLVHLLDDARAAGVQRLSLETGSEPEFSPARRLYAQHGFVPCPPFADYRLDPHSVYMTLSLAP